MIVAQVQAGTSVASGGHQILEPYLPRLFAQIFLLPPVQLVLLTNLSSSRILLASRLSHRRRVGSSWE